MVNFKENPIGEVLVTEIPFVKLTEEEKKRVRLLVRQKTERLSQATLIHGDVVVSNLDLSKETH